MQELNGRNFRLEVLVVMYMLFLAVGSLRVHAQAADSRETGNLTAGLETLSYLKGQFKVRLFLPDGKGGWQETGGGTAEYKTILDGCYIRESVAVKTPRWTITMDNTIGIDGRTKQPRMIALDKEYSTMDVYEGKLDGSTLIFNNLHSDRRFTTSRGDKLAFRITLSRLDEHRHQMLVEYTKDEGQNWGPYVRQEFLPVSDDHQID